MHSGLKWFSSIQMPFMGHIVSHFLHSRHLSALISIAISFFVSVANISNDGALIKSLGFVRYVLLIIFVRAELY